MKRVIAAIPALCLLTALSPLRAQGTPSTADIAAEYRATVEAEDRLSPNSSFDRDRWDIDQKLTKLLAPLEPAGIEWWKSHTEKDLPNATDDDLLELLAPNDTFLAKDLTPHQTAAVAQALSRPTFASIVESWPWSKVEQVSDDQLQRLWNNHLSHFSDTAEANRELMLVEMTRRKGKKWQDFLESQIAMRDKDLQNRDRADLWRQLSSELPLTTALRRIEGKPDPIAIEPGASSYDATFPNLPTLNLALVNVDGQDVTLQDGGDYRSGRLMRWRILVQDEKGRNMPWCKWLALMGGGISTERALKPQETKTYELPIGNYIAPLPPGNYTMRIQFHNTIEIADRDDISNLLVFASKELKLTIKPLELKDGVAHRKQADILIAMLPTDGSTKIIDGTYGDWARDFVRPDSAQGKLLSMGFDALPALIDAANDNGTNELRRATILGMLYSLTRTFDPRAQPGVLAQSEARQGPWSIHSGSAMGFGESAVWFTFGDKSALIIDPKKQMELAAKWKTWAQTIIVDP